jgi:hypothetical protein
MISVRMARPGDSLRAGPENAFAGVLVLASMHIACGTAESGPEPRPGTPTEYEGPNFYEMSAAPPVPGQLLPSGQPSIGELPGFMGFVSEEEALLSCSAATERREPPTLDPTLSCAPITRPTISDFSYAGGDGTGVSFGADSDVRGGTYFYASEPGNLRSDVTGNDWHLSGRVSGISGFGLYLDGCALLDGSAFGGLEFNLWGNIGAGGSLVFFVGTADNQISYTWLNENRPTPDTPDERPNLGRCIPFTTRYDGTCSEPRATLTVAEEPVVLQVAWRDLGNGCPSVSVVAEEVTSIAWYFPEAASGPYDVDIHIDNLRFANASPL